MMGEGGGGGGGSGTFAGPGMYQQVPQPLGGVEGGEGVDVGAGVGGE